MTADRPATEPRPFYDGPVCSRCGHEPHDGRPDPRCPEIVGGWDQPMPTPDYCGCTDVDALYGRLVRAEAAQGAAPSVDKLDVERFRQAIENVENMNPLDYLDDGDTIDAYAAEYRRLSGAPQEGRAE